MAQVQDLASSSRPADDLALNHANPVEFQSDEKMHLAVTPDQFLANRESLTGAINELQRLVTSLDQFNAQHWSIRYPQLAAPAQGSSSSSSTSPSASSAPVTPSLHRSQTLDPHEERPSLGARSFTTGDDAGAQDGPQQQKKKDMSILSLLDIKTGEYATGNNTLPALLPSLSQATLAQLLTRRFATSLKHLDSLRVRVQDTDSKILVTGDLNAGKSTFVNALTRREVMPVDQQPCTSVFTELVDASLNQGKEEAHAIKAEDLAKYSPQDEATFTRFAMQQLDDACIDGHEDGFVLVRVYLGTESQDTLAAAAAAAAAAQQDSAEQQQEKEQQAVAEKSDLPSFVHNGVVDISLIDAPGLNRDTLSTTALFSRQSEIDVVVFLVSAENHFTLSAKEFLWNASREKAYVFVVVNKFDGIRDKARCVKRVGEQLKQLSPATWESRAELVHFVEAAHPSDQPAWGQLEVSLREFVLQKRSVSKLLPAKTYLLNLLSDLDLLADSNLNAADAQLQKAIADLEVLRPAHEKLEVAKGVVSDELHRTEEDEVDHIRATARSMIGRAVSYISRGELPPPSEDSPAVHPAVKPFNAPDHLPAYPGIMSVWSWAEEMKSTLLDGLEGALRQAEEYARNQTISGVQHITGHLASTFLPPSEEPKTEQRVFRPEVMFARHRKARLALTHPRSSVTSVGLSAAPPAPSSAEPSSTPTSKVSKDIELSVLDLFDFERLCPHLFSHHASGEGSNKLVLHDADAMSRAASVSTLGLGTLTLYGSRTLGVEGVVNTISTVAEFFGSKTAKKLAAPVITVISIGLAVYIVVDIPRAITANIGRKIQFSLESQSEPTGYADVEADRISKESRKVLRLASWELREQFRKAFEKSQQECASVEDQRVKSQHALEWLENFVQQLDQQKTQVDAVELDA